jgi:hypothetical protein
MSRAMELLVDLKKVVDDSDLLKLLEQVEKNLKSYDSTTALETFNKVRQWLNNEELRGTREK